MDNNNNTKFSFNSDDFIASVLSGIGVLGTLAGLFVVVTSLFSRNTNYAIGFSVLFGSIFMLGFSVLVKAAAKYLNQEEGQK
jgi:zinc transporter ZupT